jgi:hypothetical protein
VPTGKHFSGEKCFPGKHFSIVQHARFPRPVERVPSQEPAVPAIR